MEDWTLFAERLTVITLFALSRMCYKIAEWFGRMGISFEFRYREMATP